MSPPIKSFPAKDIPSEVQVGVNGKVRKTVDGRPIDLVRDCELQKLVQYECLVTQPEVAHSPTQCWPVQRLFRRCQDKNGTFTVETTAWEGPEAATPIIGKSGRGHAISGPGIGQIDQTVAKLPKS